VQGAVLAVQSVTPQAQRYLDDPSVLAVAELSPSWLTPVAGYAMVRGEEFPQSLSYVFEHNYYDSTPLSKRTFTYKLDRQYHRFQANVGLEDGSTLPVTFEVVIDGIHKKSITIRPSESAAPIEWDITGADRLELHTMIIVPSTSPPGEATAVWGNALLE